MSKLFAKTGDIVFVGDDVTNTGEYIRIYDARGAFDNEHVIKLRNGQEIACQDKDITLQRVISESLAHYTNKQVEIPVHYDLWMMGARHGKVTGWRRGKPGHADYLMVRMDNERIKRRVKIWRGDIPYMKVES